MKKWIAVSGALIGLSVAASTREQRDEADRWFRRHSGLLWVIAIGLWAVVIWGFFLRD